MTFYNVCPAEIESGGPELAHQMCHRLNDAGLEAYMYYIKSNDINPQDVNASDKYIKYNTFHAKQLSEIEQDTSVVQSKYAYEYVRDVVGADEKNIMYVSDYIGDIYMTEVPEILRQNIVLYNPKKGLDRIKPVMERTSSWLKWIPLIGLTEEDMTAYMHIARIYIDFGGHPGKDRIPREAAVCGCCVITNRRGSAGYYEDVPIPDRYKFENETDYEGIENCMHYICDNFYEARKDFEYYIDQIKQEKSKFNDDVVKFSNFFMNRG